jgi:LysM repeat protein
MQDLNLEALPAPTVEADVAPAVEPEPVAAPTAEPEAALPPPAKPIVHTVEEGETILTLADQFGVSPETIMAANSLRNPDMLQVGQDLVILPTDGVLEESKSGE